MEGITEEKEREITIRDNTQQGAWDFDLLGNAWDDLPLADWGLDLPEDWITRPEDGDKAGASPWDRVGDALEGIMLSFGEVQARLPIDLYQRFEAVAPKDKDELAAWLRNKINEICNS